jgi:phage FluMu protein Com
MSDMTESIIYNSSFELLRKPILHPSTINLVPVRCPLCNHLLGFIEGKAQIKCNKCKYIHLAELRVAPTTSALI